VAFGWRGPRQGLHRVVPTIVYLSAKGAYGLPSELEPFELRVALTDTRSQRRIIGNQWSGR